MTTLDTTAQWRQLALQFDGHRMQAIWHLKALLLDPVRHQAAAAAFLEAAPKPAITMLSRLQEIDNHLAKCRFTERHAARQLVAAMVIDLAAQPAPASSTSSNEWANAERIANLSTVDEALRNFSADSTADNATGLVSAVLRAAVAAPIYQHKSKTDHIGLTHWVDCTQEIYDTCPEAQRRVLSAATADPEVATLRAGCQHDFKIESRGYDGVDVYRCVHCQQTKRHIRRPP